MYLTKNKLYKSTFEAPIIRLLQSIKAYYFGEHSYLEEVLCLIDKKLKSEIMLLSLKSKKLKQDPTSSNQCKLSRLKKILSGLYCLRHYINGKPLTKMSHMKYTDFVDWCDQFVREWKYHFNTTIKKKRKQFSDFIDNLFFPGEEGKLSFDSAYKLAQSHICELQTRIRDVNRYIN